MLAHTLGNTFNLSYVKELCKKYDLWLIEDCCDALGSTYENKHVGSFGRYRNVKLFPCTSYNYG